MTRKNNNDKRSFVFYDSFLEAMKHLNDSEFRECVMRIRDYALEGIDEESQSPYVNIILAMAKPNLDSARRRYMASVENGKKGAEFGELGGAPKGNKNASKKQPLKQPLDVDVDVDDNDNVNEDVDVDVDVNVNVEVDDYTNTDVNNDAESTPTELVSSYNTSIQGVNNQIENNSEQFEDREEKIKPLQEVNSSHSNSCDVRAAGKNTSEALSSKVDSSSAARPQQREERGEDMSSYMERVINRDLGRLATMKQQGKEFDKTLLNATIDNVIALYGRYDYDSAYKAIIHSIDTVLGRQA